MNTWMKLSLLFFAITACTKPLAAPDRTVDASTDAAVDHQEPIKVDAAVDAVPTVPDTSKRDAMEAHVLKMMKTWAPARSMPNHDISHYPFIARDITDVVLSEPPLWPGDTDRWRTAVLLTTMAFWEGHFWVHVDDGSCNDGVWRKTKAGVTRMATTGDCDGGWAVSLWQIHPEGGIVLTDDGGWKHLWDAPGSKAIGSKEMLADRRLAARVALHMLRKSLRMSGGLVGYTGEGSCPCPKAQARLAASESWWHKHPLMENLVE